MKSIHLLKRLSALVLGLCLGATALLAQNPITVNGTILDPNKEPVIGAAVFEVSNTKNGAVTDIDGKFSITVPMGAKLNVSAIGYETLEIVAASSTLNITLQEEATDRWWSVTVRRKKRP